MCLLLIWLNLFFNMLKFMTFQKSKHISEMYSGQELNSLFSCTSESHAWKLKLETAKVVSADLYLMHLFLPADCLLTFSNSLANNVILYSYLSKENTKSPLFLKVWAQKLAGANFTLERLCSTRDKSFLPKHSLVCISQVFVGKKKSNLSWGGKILCVRHARQTHA